MLGHPLQKTYDEEATCDQQIYRLSENESRKMKFQSASSMWRFLTSKYLGS